MPPKAKKQSAPPSPDISGLVEFAAFHNHPGLIEALVKIVEEGNLSQAANSRLNFFRFRSSIEGLSFAGVDDAVLEAFSNLESAFKTDSLSKGITEVEWIECQRKLVTLVALGLIVEALQLNLANTPKSVKEIAVPSGFNFRNFESDVIEAIDGLFAALPEDTEFIAQLKKSLTTDIATTKNKKKTLDELKIFDLFASNPLERLKNEARDFLAQVEQTVLGIPQLAFSYKFPQKDVDAAIEAVAEKDHWTEKEAQEQGPHGKRRKNPATVPAAAAAAVEVPPTRAFASPIVEPQTTRQQPITPGRKHHEEVHVSKAVNDFQRKYAQQDPLDAAVAQEPVAARKRKANEDVEETETPAVKRGKASVASSAVPGKKSAAVPASSPVKSAAKPSAAAAAAAAAAADKKSIVGGRPSGSKITFDEEDEIGEYETDEDEEQDERAAPPSKAMALLNHARHAIDDTTKRIGLPQPRLQDEVSRFHPKDAPPPKPRKVEDSHAFNRNPKMGTRNRLPWTAEEKEALVRGLYKYGVGAWSKIVDDITIASVFQNRTNVDVKDKYRTMVKSREIDPDDFEAFKQRQSSGGGGRTLADGIDDSDSD